MRITKNNLLKLVIVGVVFSLFLVGSASAMSGSGTADDPYILTTAQDVLDISNAPSAYYELGNNISMSSLTNPQIATFSGHLDGKGYTISGVTNNTGGLFGTFNNVTLTNITFDGFSITQNDNTANCGGVVNTISGNTNILSGAKITNSSIVNNNSGAVGGFVGLSDGGLISGASVENCYISGAGKYTGGFVGINGRINIDSWLSSDCKVVNCYIESSNSDSNSAVGGFSALTYVSENMPSDKYYNNCDVIGCYISGLNAGGFIGNVVSFYVTKSQAFTWTFTFSNCDIKNNLIIGTDVSAGFIGYSTEGGTNLGYDKHFVTSIDNCNVLNNSIYSENGNSSLISDSSIVSGTARKGYGHIRAGTSVFDRNLVYSANGTVSYAILNKCTGNADGQIINISNSNVYGTTIQTLPTYVVLDNVVNTQGLYHSSPVEMTAEQIDEYGTIRLSLNGGFGTGLSVDTTNHTVNSNVTLYDGTETVNNLKTLIYEKIYPNGTYTANSSFKLINPQTLNDTSYNTSETFTVQKLSPEGSGTESDPYRITNVFQLQWIETHLDSYYKIMNAIDLTGVTWRQIDNFTGHIDGNNQTISNLTLNTLDGGLFNHAVNAEIKDLTLSNFDITTTKTDTNSSSGILVGYVNGGSYTGIKIKDSKLNASTHYIGGIIGFINGNNAITIEYNEVDGCEIQSNVVSDRRVGGILGGCDYNISNFDYEVSNCNVYNTYIHGLFQYCGGVISVGSDRSTRDFTYNHVKNMVITVQNTTNDVFIGGIFGWGASNGTVNSENNLVENCIFNCNNGSVSNYGSAGGIFGNGTSASSTSTANSTNDTVINCTLFAPTYASNQDAHCASGIAGRPFLWGESTTYRTLNVTNATVTNCTFVCPHTALVCGESNGGRWESTYCHVNISGGTFTNNNIMGAYANNGLTQKTNNVVITNNPSIEGTTTNENTYLLLKSLTPSVEDYTVTINAEVVGATVDYDTTDEVITTENLSYDFGDLTTPLTTDELEVEHTYTTRGTYTTTLSAQNYLTSQAVTLESDEYDVPVTAAPTIEDEAVTPASIIQRGTDTVTLSATITSPQGQGDLSIQWKYSTDGTNYTNISGATTSTYTWTPPVGVFYVKVEATNDSGTTESTVLNLNVYGLATITKDDASPLFVELGSDATLDGAYTPSSNPVPNTYSQWKYSLDGTTWEGLLGKNVNSGTYTCDTQATVYVRYCVGDDDSGIFSYRNTYTILVKRGEQITVTADKEEAALNETVTLTATIQYQYQDTRIWQSSTDNVNFTDITGETDLELEITTSTVGNMYYRLVSTNAFGTYTSNVMNIKTYGAPTVSANVTPLTVNAGDDVTLSGTVTVNPVMGDSDYSVQWKYSDDDGVTWTNVVGGDVLNTTTSFSNYGDYKLKVVVTDDYYTVESSVFDIEVIAVPTIVSVSVTPSEAGIHGEFTLASSVTSETGAFTVQWKYKTSTATEWSNVTGGNVENCTLSGLSVGAYNVKLTATNEYGTVESQVFNISVVAEPSVTLSVDKLSVTVGDDIVFTFVVTDVKGDGMSDLQVSYDDGDNWNLLANDIESPYTHTVEVTNPCVYRISYTNSLYTVYSNEITVTGHDVPVISTITLNPNDGKIAHDDSITATTTVTSDLPTTKRWWYYDVETPQTKVYLENSNVETYTFTGLNVGEYVVGIEVTDTLGNVVTGTCPTHVKVYGEPSVRLTSSADYVVVGGNVTLTPTVTVNPTMGDDDYTVTLQVKLNNVWTTCTSPYTFSAAGTYEFRAQVVDLFFTKYSESISVECANVPTVTGETDSSTVAVGSTITLNGSITSSLPVTSYTWQVKNGSNWNDLTTSTLYTASYTLSDAGVYVFRFTASNILGSGYSDNVSVTAQEARTIAATISSSSVQVGNSVDLEAVITSPEYVAPIASQGWEISTDGGSNWNSMGVTSVTTTYTPQTQGVYDFRYKITDTLGVVSLSNTVSVTAGNIPVITLDVDSTAKVGEVQTFKAGVTSLTPLTSTEWFVNDVSIGEGSGAEFSVNYTFNTAGTYTVKFVAINALGTAYNTQTVEALNQPVITDFTVEYSTVEFGEAQRVHFKSNVNLDQLRVEQRYMDGVWTNTNAQIQLIGDTYYAHWNVYTDGSHGGTVYTHVFAQNDVGVVYSQDLSFNVKGKEPSSYLKVFETADNTAQTVMVIAGLVMLIIVGMLFIGVMTGNLDAGMAVKAFLIVGAVVVVLTFLIVFIGSMAGVITGLI